MKKPKHSSIDERGHVLVDCCECARGGNAEGVDKCSCGWQYKTPGRGCCYLGTLLPGLAFEEKEKKGSLPKKFTRSKDIVDWLFRNPSWYLEYCRSASGLDGWWWVRNSRSTSQVIRVHGNAVRASLMKLTRYDSRLGHALNETKWSAK